MVDFIQSRKNFIALAIILIMGVVYQYKYMNDLPSHIHTWANADRYAISIGFVNNQLNLFKPESYTYNKNFPNDWDKPYPETTTSVDFPIHDYLAAVAMKLFNTTEPWVFRTYQLLYSFLGLFFLFKLSNALTNSNYKSFFLLFFAATSPVFVYYQNSFLPSTPSIANAVIGVYFYYQLLQKEKASYFWYSILFLTLAALARTTFVIPLIAVMGVELIRIFKKEASFLKRLAPVVLSFLAIYLYLRFNNQLRAEHGSLFLNYLLPPTSFEDAKAILEASWDHWKYHYFSKYHYWFFVLVLLLAAYFCWKKSVQTNRAQNYFAFFVAVYAFGTVLFGFAMMKQFVDHDYYFLDSFYLPIVFLVALLLIKIPEVQPKLFKYLSFGILLIFFIQPTRSQKYRHVTESWDKNAKISTAFKGSDKFLDQLNIPKTAKILVIDPVSPNLPFILMKRKGYAVMNPSKERIAHALTWDYDYIVIQNELFYYDIYPNNPELLTHLEKIADNRLITVCKYTEGNKQSIIDFIGVQDKQPVRSERIDFESQASKVFENTTSSNKFAFEGSQSGHVDSDHEFGLNYALHNPKELATDSRILTVDAHFFTENDINSDLVVTIETKDKIIYRSSIFIPKFVTEKQTWTPTSFLFYLPKINEKDVKLSVLIYNHGKSEFFYDNLKYNIY